MDVREIKYPDSHFDLVIDKSTIDALLCGENSFVNVAIMLKEIQRILKEGGVYMIISYGSPEYRVFHLDRHHLNFEINIYTIKKDFLKDEDKKYEKVHYVYLCRKLPGADEISKANFEYVINFLQEQEKCTVELNESKEKDDDEESLEINKVYCDEESDASDSEYEISEKRANI